MMMRLTAFPLLLLAAAVLAACAARTTAAGAGEWHDLFDGRTLAGWINPYDWGEAWVEDGEIRMRADQKFFLVTDRGFRDFVFEGELKLPDTLSNSGIQFRSQVEKNRVFGYQAEADPTARRWSGGLYDEGRRQWLHPVRGSAASETAFREGPGRAFRPTEWNHYRIEARGDSLRIYLNGVLTTAYQDSLDREGVIGLQHHGEAGKIYRFRNLRIRELSGAGMR
jgi:predicted small secreted protein